ncbi:hypothetical protein RchiOBHm_Chr7g0197761 [Rosa chinensis]|uniref:Uncharacterized protein n=1 Tax=Rosa chinensis TaxID=74649 RepID=A0A2P6P6X4_ROSCH|nr:hypothetical protein RchiOBHm_Chr7g0197761 [Rosa chinensis]
MRSRGFDSVAGSSEVVVSVDLVSDGYCSLASSIAALQVLRTHPSVLLSSLLVSVSGSGIRVGLADGAGSGIRVKFGFGLRPTIFVGLFMIC